MVDEETVKKNIKTLEAVKDHKLLLGIYESFARALENDLTPERREEIQLMRSWIQDTIPELLI